MGSTLNQFEVDPRCIAHSPGRVKNLNRHEIAGVVIVKDRTGLPIVTDGTSTLSLNKTVRVSDFWS
jgi:hypothetical protein